MECVRQASDGCNVRDCAATLELRDVGSRRTHSFCKLLLVHSHYAPQDQDGGGNVVLAVAMRLQFYAAFLSARRRRLGNGRGGVGLVTLAAGLGGCWELDEITVLALERKAFMLLYWCRVRAHCGTVGFVIALVLLGKYSTLLSAEAGCTTRALNSRASGETVPELMELRC